MDEKLVLRSDGTAVYMTQDIGTAIQRTKDFSDLNGMVYTVGNEQDYHFKVLFLIPTRCMKIECAILQKLEPPKFRAYLINILCFRQGVYEKHIHIIIL